MTKRTGAIQILGMCGSLREHSYNRRLLVAAAKELPDDAEFHVFDGIAKSPHIPSQFWQRCSDYDCSGGSDCPIDRGM